MFSNDDFFKVLATFFLTTNFFIVALFFGSFLSLSEDSLVKEFVTILFYLSITSIIIFPLHFINFPFYKYYWRDGVANNISYRKGLIFSISTIILEFFVILWIFIMIITILYYPIFKNIFHLF